RNVEKYNKDHDGYPLDISLGYACSGADGVNMSELLRKADDAMGREKLHSNNSTRNSQVQILSKALECRDFITEGHAERVQNLIISTGQLAGLSEQRLSDLKLFAQFHDIGKVGIPDQILFKKGRLTGDEWEIMKQHCEIGYRIAQSTPDIYPIADWILKHHENWDGSGYPLGLAGEEIPIECRILAVADTFDAMTNDRPYRKAQSTQAAIEEILRCAGTQFDPHIVELFVKTV
ncbi:MAG: HD domain-containing phosphohydrolase, partial [Desulfitobacterium hafniense]